MTGRFNIHRESNFISNIIETLRFLFQECIPEIRFQRRRKKEILRLWNARPHSKRNMYKKKKEVKKVEVKTIKEQIEKLKESPTIKRIINHPEIIKEDKIDTRQYLPNSLLPEVKPFAMWITAGSKPIIFNRQKCQFIFMVNTNHDRDSILLRIVIHKNNTKVYENSYYYNNRNLIYEKYTAIEFINKYEELIRKALEGQNYQLMNKESWIYQASKQSVQSNRPLTSYQLEKL